mmetsp:Transcript_42485/g.68314  ORF Transcript_42485/g.68314 Transcript_42485/m.68314 type:complete len:238 (-) Transcript_42485:1244-1957(-)
MAASTLHDAHLLESLMLLLRPDFPPLDSMLFLESMLFFEGAPCVATGFIIDIMELLFFFLSMDARLPPSMDPRVDPCAEDLGGPPCVATGFIIDIMELPPPVFFLSMDVRLDAPCLSLSMDGRGRSMDFRSMDACRSMGGRQGPFPFATAAAGIGIFACIVAGGSVVGSEFIIVGDSESPRFSLMDARRVRLFEAGLIADSGAVAIPFGIKPSLHAEGPGAVAGGGERTDGALWPSP